MIGPRFSRLVILSLALAFVLAQTTLAQGPETKRPSSGTAPATLPLAKINAESIQLVGHKKKTKSKTKTKKQLTVKVYALGDLGDDPKLGPWLAETIPTVVKPGSWAKEAKKGSEGKCLLTYYAPGKVLVVHHTAAVQ